MYATYPFTVIGMLTANCYETFPHNCIEFLLFFKTSGISFPLSYASFAVLCKL